MKKTNFHEEYFNSNKLVASGKFQYIDDVYTVSGFSKSHIKAECAGKKIKITPYEFEGWIYYRFVTIL